MSTNKILRDAANWTMQASLIQLNDQKCKANDPNSHYNPETDRCEPGA
jgi:hypothetical protein